MTKQPIEELLENLIYDAVVEHREELESNTEWRRVKEEFDTAIQKLKNSIFVLNDETSDKMQELFGNLIDKHSYLINLAELNAYRNGFNDGAKLILKILSDDIVKI